MPDFDALAGCVDRADVPLVAPFDARAAQAARPVRLPRAMVSREHVDITRLVGRGCFTRIDSLDAVLSLQPAKAAQSTWSEPMLLQGPFGSIELCEGVRMIRALTGIDPGAQAPADDERWEWLQAALIGRLEGTPFGSVDRLDRLVRGCQSDETGLLTLCVTLRAGGHAVATHARASAAAWLDLLGRTAWTRERRAIEEWLHLPVEVPVRIARHTLPAHALRGMTQGDIVLPDSPEFTCDGEGSVRIGMFNAQVRYQAPNSLEIIAVEGQLNAEELEEDDDRGAGEAAMPGGNAAEAADDGSVAASPAEEIDPARAKELDMLPVALTFELGRARLLMRDLCTLGEGAIIPFSGGSPASVAILAGGRAIGRGEVVAVNGELGIRITQWGLK